MFANLLIIDDRTPRGGALNMAIDEALLQTTRSTVLRVYRWSEPSVSFGYFGKAQEAREYARGRAIVRRWTGGGIVPHGDDLTYSLMIVPTDAAFRLSSRIIYQRVHEAIAACLRDLGLRVALAGANAPRISDACFANPVLADVMAGEEKIAGAAHRKTRTGLLHQGSIQHRGLGEDFPEMIARALSHTAAGDEIGPAVLAAAQDLAAEKYGTETWLNQR